MKLRAPAGMKTFVHEGEQVAIGEDGSVDVRASDAENFKAHGFSVWDDQATDVPIEQMSHAQMVLLVLERTKATLERMSASDLRARLLSINPDTVILPDESEAPGVSVDPDKVSAADIEGMKRAELFAFLKAKGIAVAPPIRNDELREYARLALADEAHQEPQGSDTSDGGSASA